MVVATRKQEILEAALDAFVAKGYEATTIADLCTRSGASVGSIYHRFGDKHGIAAELFVDCLHDYQRGIVALLEDEPSAREGIEGLVRHFLGWVSASPHRAMFMLERREPEVRAEARERVEAANRETFAAIRAWLKPHVDAGEIRPMPLRLLYAIVFGPSQEYTRQWLRERGRERLEESESALARAAWAGVRGKEASE
jgi:AcrR family transcriptional regulator